MPCSLPLGYPFVYIGKRRSFDYDAVCYRFRSTKTGKKYVVHFQVFSNDLYGLKFYLSDCKHTSKRFQIQTNLGEAKTVFFTCANIALDFIGRFPCASLVFVGEHKVGEVDHNRTQRFLIYENLTATFVSGESFFHAELPQCSTYMLVNRHIEDIHEYIKNVLAYARQTYMDFDDVADSDINLILKDS